jgi:hypothetical protein
MTLTSLNAVCCLTGAVHHYFLLKLMLDICSDIEITIKPCMLGQHDDSITAKLSA